MAEEFETVTVSELDDFTLALSNYFAHSNINGKLGKSTFSDLVSFLSPYVAALGGAQYTAVSGTVLPNLTNQPTAFTFLAPGTYTQTTGGSLTLTEIINIVSWNGTSWSLTKAIQFPNVLLKSEYNFKGTYATVAAANAAVTNTVVNGKNQRDGSRVDIGTAGNYVTYWWKGGTADANLVEYIDVKSQYKGSFNSVIDAFTAIPLAQRKVGDTVSITTPDGVVGYIWKSTTTNAGLVPIVPFIIPSIIERITDTDLTERVPIAITVVGNSVMLANGTFTTSNSWNRIDPLPVKKGEIYAITNVNNNTANDGRTAFFNSSNVLVGYLGTVSDTVKTDVVVIPDDGFIVVSTVRALSLYIYVDRITIKGERMPFVVVNNASTGPSGELVAPSPNYMRSDYIPVKYGDVFDIIHTIEGHPDGRSNICAYDVNKVFVTRLASGGYDSLEINRRVRIVAPVDGFIIVPHRKSASGTFKISKGRYMAVTDVPKAALVEPLPLLSAGERNYNSGSANFDNVTVGGGFEYAVIVGPNREPFILKRVYGGGAWQTSSLLGTVIGQIIADAHNTLSVAVTKDGYIIVTGNAHVATCKCIISNNPHDITSWTSKPYTNATVTYPKFVKHPDGRLFVFFRSGGSTSGTSKYVIFNDTTRTWNPEFILITPQTTPEQSPYEQKILISPSGVIKIMFGFRTVGGADANSGMYYMESADGVIWKEPASNTTYSMPVTFDSAVKIIDVPVGTGYVNQNGAALDNNGLYHSAVWKRDSQGYTQYLHIWQDTATSWKSDIVSNNKYSLTLTASLLRGELSRPSMFCSADGTPYIIYKSDFAGLKGQIRLINCNTKEDSLLINLSAGTGEFNFSTEHLRQFKIVRMLISNSIFTPDNDAYTGYATSIPIQMVTFSI